jgi:hypothetical protein
MSAGPSASRPRPVSPGAGRGHRPGQGEASPRQPRSPGAVLALLADRGAVLQPRRGEHAEPLHRAGQGPRRGAARRARAGAVGEDRLA